MQGCTTTTRQGITRKKEKKMEMIWESSLETPKEKRYEE